MSNLVTRALGAVADALAPAPSDAEQDATLHADMTEKRRRRAAMNIPGTDQRWSDHEVGRAVGLVRISELRYSLDISDARRARDLVGAELRAARASTVAAPAGADADSHIGDPDLLGGIEHDLPALEQVAQLREARLTRAEDRARALRLAQRRFGCTFAAVSAFLERRNEQQRAADLPCSSLPVSGKYRHTGVAGVVAEALGGRLTVADLDELSAALDSRAELEEAERGLVRYDHYAAQERARVAHRGGARRTQRAESARV